MKKKVFFTTTLLMMLLLTVVPAYANGGGVVIDARWRTITIDSKVGGGFWADVNMKTHALVYDMGGGHYKVVATQTGRFRSWAGDSPGGTGKIGEGVKGKVTGGFVAHVWGDPEDISGSLGTFDYECDHFGNCSDYVSWRDILFDSHGKWYYESWGWVYTTCGNGTWINSSAGNHGDILGEYIPCPPRMPKPEVKGLYAFVNPAEDKNICYILANGMPGIERDVKRLCFTESNPDWWEGASYLTHGDVFDNGTDWGYWEGDPVVEAYSNAKRLPLHAEGPDNDLGDKAEKYYWTQE